VMLIVPLIVEPNANLPAGPVNLKANVSWLECKDVCIPASTDVEAKLNIGSEAKTSDDAALIQTWQNKVPKPLTNLVIRAWWEKPASGNTRPLIIEWSAFPSNQPPTSNVRFVTEAADFFPDASDNYEIQPATENLSKSPLDVIWRKDVKKYSGDWPKEISGVLVMQDGLWSGGHEIKLSVGAELSAPEAIFSTANESPALPPQSLWRMLLFAFIGGLILNIMPCVLPVIALKILGFVSEARSEPRRVRKLGLIYALGVLLSFLALAALVIGVKAAGHHAGWGMQFGSPVFIVCLTTLVTLVALNLFGVFEVTLGGSALDAAGNLASRHGASGAFFNGVLATVLATPCTASILGTALGFAFLQPPTIIILIFLAVGTGLAAPYVLLSWNPKFLKFLPKPGAWMEKFKMAMGFPMLVTAVWLFNIAGSTYGKNVFWLGAFLVVVAFAAWIFGEFVQRGRKHKPMAAMITIILLIAGYGYALEKELDWRAPFIETDSTGSLKTSANGLDWQRWSPEAVAQARVAGKIVLVDFTADWCVTCNAIVKPALESDAVSTKLKGMNAVVLLADDTHTPANIADELAKHERAGVPLLLVYPQNAGLPPIVLPEPSPLSIPSSYGRLVLDALDQAAK
jgi:thiol:disulfide interchange protein